MRPANPLALLAHGATVKAAGGWGGLARLFQPPVLPPPPPPPPPPFTLQQLGAWLHATMMRADEPPHLAAARPAICSVYADVVLLQSTVLTLILVGGILFFTLTRARYVARLKGEQRRARASASASPSAERDGPARGTLPGVTVVMPCKGVHAQSYSNWQSHVTAEYGGPLEFIFAVESEDDAAYALISQLINVSAAGGKVGGGGGGGGGGGEPRPRVRLSPHAPHPQRCARL